MQNTHFVNQKVFGSIYIVPILFCGVFALAR